MAADNTVAVSSVVTGPGVDVATKTYHNVSNLNINFGSQVLSFTYAGPMGPSFLEISMASVGTFSASISSGVWSVTLS